MLDHFIKHIPLISEEWFFSSDCESEFSICSKNIFLGRSRPNPDINENQDVFFNDFSGFYSGRTIHNDHQQITKSGKSFGANDGFPNFFEENKRKKRPKNDNAAFNNFEDNGFRPSIPLNPISGNY